MFQSTLMPIETNGTLFEKELQTVTSKQMQQHLEGNTMCSDSQ